jgi:hypothetical protein
MPQKLEFEESVRETVLGSEERMMNEEVMFPFLF